nr:hypothetical protein [Tanacetum cinerariifolium]
MHSMGNTATELHAMLKLHEQTLPPREVVPALHAIRTRRIQKNQKKKSHKDAKGNQGKGKAKMGNALVPAPSYAPKPKNHPTPKKDNPAKDMICHQCDEVDGKKTLFTSSGKGKDLLGLIYTDVYGPFKIMSRQGAYYFVTFTDDISRYGYVYLLKRKHEVFKNDHGIITHKTPPYTPQHNGVSERRNKTLLYMGRSMMSQTTLPNSFWDYALESVARNLNMVPTKKGCEALVKRDTLTKPDNLEPRAFECVFVGYSEETMGYSFYYLPKNKVFVARNSKFFKNDVIDHEASGSLEDLEIIQEEDTRPSLDTSLNHEEDDQEIDEPQSDINPIRRSTKTHRAPDRMCLYIDAEEHELGDLGKPSNYKAALLDPESDKWLNAMNVEIQSMKDNEVWELVDLPPDKKTIGHKWHFKKKTGMDGAVHTYKARLVAKGFTQTPGVDYEETFSPFADIRAIRILISIAAFYDYEIWQMDVKISFLNGYLNEEKLADMSDTPLTHWQSPSISLAVDPWKRSKGSNGKHYITITSQIRNKTSKEEDEMGPTPAGPLPPQNNNDPPPVMRPNGSAPRTMVELCQPSINGRGGPIALIPIQATEFGLHHHVIQQVQNTCQFQVQNTCQFHRLPGDDANRHTDKFLEVTQQMKQNEVSDDALRLSLFPYSLTHHATAWYDRLPRNSNTFDDMMRKFLSKYFPPSMDTLATRDETSRSIYSTTTTESPEVVRQLEMMNKTFLEMMKQMQTVKDVDTKCETCGGPYSYTECLAVDGYTQKVSYATMGNFNSGANTKEELKATTTRSGVAYDGPIIPPTHSLLPKEVEHETEATKDKKLSLSDLTSTRMTLELATRTYAYPAGIAKDVFVQVGKFTFPSDFVVVDYDVDPRVPIFLGILFLGRPYHSSSDSSPSLTPIETGDSLLEEFIDELAFLDLIPSGKEDNNFDLNPTLEKLNFYDDDDLFYLKSDNDEWKKLLYGDCYKNIEKAKNKDSKMKSLVVEDHIVESNDLLP